jgi:hypothetical protein
MGSSLRFIGLAVRVADARVAFFLPTAKTGRQGTFLTGLVVLGAMSLALMMTGSVMRSEPEE